MDEFSYEVASLRKGRPPWKYHVIQTLTSSHSKCILNVPSNLRRTILATLMEVEEEEEGWEERKEANRQPIEPASSHKSVDTMLSSGNSTRTNSIDSTHEDGTMESLLESVGLDRQGKPQVT